MRERVERIGRAGILLGDGLYQAVLPPYDTELLLRQVDFIGARSISVVAVSGLFVGMVVALQFHDTLVRFGAVGLMGAAVGLSLVRELAPVLASLMVVGRAGSALCAELAIMRSEQQVDALECMAINPVRYLIAPRLAAALLSMPLLVAIFVVVGVIGGWLVATVLLGIGSGSYFGGLAEAVTRRDLFMCLVKAVSFGTIMCWVACAKGYFMHLDPRGAFGAEGVSRTTTEAVVLAAISILVADYLISAILLG